jgi:NADH:ubiquinone oxidoreductase subunit H
MIWFSILTKLIDFIIIIVIVLISLAYLTLIERKVMGIMQRRKGPNVVGILGLLQPLNASGILIQYEKIRLYAEKFKLN